MAFLNGRRRSSYMEHEPKTLFITPLSRHMYFVQDHTTQNLKHEGQLDLINHATRESEKQPASASLAINIGMKANQKRTCILYPREIREEREKTRARYGYDGKGKDGGWDYL